MTRRAEKRRRMRVERRAFAQAREYLYMAATTVMSHRVDVEVLTVAIRRYVAAQPKRTR